VCVDAPPHRKAFKFTGPIAVGPKHKAHKNRLRTLFIRVPTNEFDSLYFHHYFLRSIFFVEFEGSASVVPNRPLLAPQPTTKCPKCGGLGVRDSYFGGIFGVRGSCAPIAGCVHSEFV